MKTKTFKMKALFISHFLFYSYFFSFFLIHLIIAFSNVPTLHCIHKAKKE